LTAGGFHHTIVQGLHFQHTKGCAEMWQHQGVKQGTGWRKLWICSYITLYLRSGAD